MSKYPGLGLPLRHYIQPDPDSLGYPIGIHGNSPGATSNIFPVREVAMFMIMDKLTDKPDWQKKVFDDEIIAKWREEALEFPDDLLWKQAVGGKMNSRDVNEDDVDWASSGLESLKAIISKEAFKNSGLIPTFDACATVVKSDTLVPWELQAELRNAFDKLKTDQKASPDWHPNSSEMVQDLIHPSMYPLVYGRSRVLEAELVGVDYAIDKWAGKGAVLENLEKLEKHNDPDPHEEADHDVGPDPYEEADHDVGPDPYEGATQASNPDEYEGADLDVDEDIPLEFWSDTYQWLPSNVAFHDDGSVKFMSYINNLHPQKYPDIYRTVEKLLGKALPAWDQCLSLSVGFSN